MLAASNVNGAGSLSAKFMVMSIGKVGTEFDLMIVVRSVVGVNRFSSYRAESMIMAVLAFPKDTGAAGQFVNMILLFTTRLTIIHFESSFLLLGYDEKTEM